MAVEVRVDWNRFFLGVVIGAGVILGIVLLITSAPSPGRRIPPQGDTPRTLREDLEKEVGLKRPTATAAGPAPDWRYSQPEWDFEARSAARTDSVRVTILDSEAPEEVRVRAAGEGREWVIVTVAVSYKGRPSSAGARIDFANLRAASADGHSDGVVSVRPVGQDFFKVFDRRDFPPIALDPGQMQAELEVLFRLRAGGGKIVLESADGKQP